MLCRWLAGARGRAGRGRGSRLAPAPADRRTGRPRGRADPGRRRGPVRRGARAQRRRRRRRHPRPPVPDRPRARQRRGGRAGRVGGGRRAADRRGRLRRRVPLRPRRHRRAPGPGAGAGRLHRLGQQALAPGMRLGWMLLPSWLGLAADPGEGDRGRRLARRSASSPCATSSSAASSTATCGGRGSTTSGAARPWSSTGEVAAGGALGNGAAGLFETVALPSEVDEAAAIAAAAERGVGVEGLALHRFPPEGPAGPARLRLLCQSPRSSAASACSARQSTQLGGGAIERGRPL